MALPGLRRMGLNGFGKEIGACRGIFLQTEQNWKQFIILFYDKNSSQYLIIVGQT